MAVVERNILTGVYPEYGPTAAERAEQSKLHPAPAAPPTARGPTAAPGACYRVARGVLRRRCVSWCFSCRCEAVCFVVCFVVFRGVLQRVPWRVCGVL